VSENFPHYTGRSPVGRRPTGVAHSKIARVARVVFVLYVLGRASWSAVFDCDVVLSDP